MQMQSLGKNFLLRLSLLMLLAPSLIQSPALAQADTFDNVKLTGKNLETETRLNKAIARSTNKGPQLSALYLERGRFYKKLAIYEKAQEDLQRAYQADPKSGIAYLERGELLWSMEYFEKSIPDCLKAGQLLSGVERARAYRTAGRCYSKTAKYAEAIKCYSEALTSEAPHTKNITMRDRAKLYLHLQKYKEALKDGDELVVMAGGANGTNSQIFYLRGEARLGLGMWQGAVDDLTNAIKHASKSRTNFARTLFDDDTPKYYRSRALAYQRLHRADLEKKDMEQARALESNALQFAPFR